MNDSSKQAIDENDPANEVMCTCTGTTRGRIYDLVAQGKDLEAISQHTGILTGCGGCEWEVSEFVKALQVQA